MSAALLTFALRFSCQAVVRKRQAKDPPLILGKGAVGYSYHDGLRKRRMGNRQPSGLGSLQARSWAMSIGRLASSFSSSTCDSIAGSVYWTFWPLVFKFNPGQSTSFATRPCSSSTKRRWGTSRGQTWTRSRSLVTCACAGVVSGARSWSLKI